MAQPDDSGVLTPSSRFCRLHDRLAAVSPARLFLILYIVSVALDLAFGVAIKFRLSPDGLEADEAEYYEIATRILRGGLQWDARRTLAFPAFVAGIRAISDSLLLVQVVLTACYALSPPLLALLARKLSGSTAAGALAGLMLTFWPPGVFYGASLYSESLALPFFLATMLALPLGSRLTIDDGRFRWGMALACGALLGLTTHIRPMYLLFTPILCLIVLAEERRSARAIGRLVAIGIGYAAVILPWSVAMTAHFGHPILVTANGGETLAGGLNPVLAKGGDVDVDDVAGRKVWTGPGKWIPIHQTGYLSAEELGLPYDRKDALLRARTRAWILSHKWDALRLEACKLGYMWGVHPFFANGPEQALFGNLPTIVALLAGMATLWLWPAARVRLVRLWMLPVFVSAVALISWGSWRFRQPGDAGLLGMIAIALVYAVVAKRSGRSATNS